MRVLEKLPSNIDTASLPIVVPQSSRSLVSGVQPKLLFFKFFGCLSMEICLNWLKFGASSALSLPSSGPSQLSEECCHCLKMKHLFYGSSKFMPQNTAMRIYHKCFLKLSILVLIGWNVQIALTFCSIIRDNRSASFFGAWEQQLQYFNPKPRVQSALRFNWVYKTPSRHGRTPRPLMNSQNSQWTLSKAHMS